MARIGGDEFVVILPSVDLNENETIFGRINTGIDNFNKSNIDDDLYRPISMSMGFSVIQEGESLKEGYKEADKAMYITKKKKAKESGPTL